MHLSRAAGYGVGCCNGIILLLMHGDNFFSDHDSVFRTIGFSKRPTDRSADRLTEALSVRVHVLSDLISLEAAFEKMVKKKS